MCVCVRMSLCVAGVHAWDVYDNLGIVSPSLSSIVCLFLRQSDTGLYLKDSARLTG